MNHATIFIQVECECGEIHLLSDSDGRVIEERFTPVMKERYEVLLYTCTTTGKKEEAML